MLAGRDILVVGQQAWDIEIGSNCKNVALEFSKHNRVLYVNPPLDRITVLRNKNDRKVKKRLALMRGKGDGLVQLNENMWNLYPEGILESINWLKINWLFDLLNKRNNKIFAAAIKKALKKLDFKNTIIFNDGDMFRSLHLAELIHPELSVYYSRDNYMATDYYKHHGRKAEPLLISKSDVCLTNSDYLANYCKRYNANSYNVGQGCDVEMFTEVADNDIPADIAKISKPVIGYIGALIDIRLDIDLLAYIALNNPGYSLVLVGPEDNTFATSKLHQLNNVHFLGVKEPEELPAYISTFDVCINPQKLNELTVGNYPRKIDEYLAMGKPVVATETPAMRMFKKYIFTAQNKEEYSGLIRLALTEDNALIRQQRINFALTHTWANHVKKIYNAISKTLKEKARSAASQQLTLQNN